jgi:hypothetical protein
MSSFKLNKTFPEHIDMIQECFGERKRVLDVAHEQLLTGLWLFWLVHLRLETGEDSWFEYAKLNIRPR